MGTFKDLTKFERILWACSVLVITVSSLISGAESVLSLIASLIGVTALIFLARGFVTGQLLCIVFSTLYGIISLKFRYYGELITYVFMTAPMAVIATISWIRHPYEDTKEVEVARVTAPQITVMSVLTVIVTATFYFILKALATENLILSTVSISTSFAAVYLTALRSPYYALGYSANDIVLIGLWLHASFTDISYLPMVMCFTMFLLNDLYGFYSWRKMEKRQL